MTTLHLDFESFSAVELKKTGVYAYAAHPTTDIWCMAYAFDDEPVQVWAPGDPIPNDIVEHVLTGGLCVGHNAQFERVIWHYILGPRYGFPEPHVTQWRCTMVMAYSMGLPGSLEMAAPAAGIDLAKDMVGRRLMLQMAKPRETKFAAWYLATIGKLQRETSWRDIPFDAEVDSDTDADGWQSFRLPGGRKFVEVRWWNTDEKVKRLVAYCKVDVEVERHLEKRLKPLKKSELALWHLDQVINDRGVLVDQELAEAARRIVEIAEQKLDARMAQVTNYEVIACSNRNQIIEFMRLRGVDADSIAKDQLEELLAPDSGIPDDVREVLVLRREAAKASVAKIDAIQRGASPEDNRAKGLLQFHAASTGRWSGRRFQPQNLKRPEESAIGLIIDLILAGDYDMLEMAFGEALSAVSDILRGLIVALQGHRILAADYSNIEGRVLAWLAGEERKLEAFRAFDAGTGHDLYKITAGSILNKRPEDVTKDERQAYGKVPELACLGGGTLVITDAGMKRLEDVTLSDKLWDGVEWVTHAGVLPRGNRQVVNLDGIEATGDHLIKTGATWRPVRELVSNKSTLALALATGSGNLPWPVSMKAPREVCQLYGSSARAVKARTESTCPISGAGNQLGATLVPKNPAHVGAKIISRMQTLCRTVHTVGDFLTGYPLATPDAAAQTPRVGRTTVAEVSEFTGRKAEKADGLFSNTSSLWKGGTTRAWSWIGSTWTTITRQATCVLSRGKRIEKTNVPFAKCNGASQTWKPVFDIASAGPRNRFTVATDSGFLIVHNCGYQGGYGAFVTMGVNYGVDLPEQRVRDIVSGWREAHPNTKRFWYDMEEAAIAAVDEPGSSFTVAGKITFRVSGSFLTMRLPSGRHLFYPYPEIRSFEVPWKNPDGSQAMKDGLTYMSEIDMSKKAKVVEDPRNTKNYARIKTYGGMIAENATQAVARDILADAMQRLDPEGMGLLPAELRTHKPGQYPIVLTVHDEIVCEVPDGVGSVDEMEAIMCELPAWAAGLPVAAEGFEDVRYRK